MGEIIKGESGMVFRIEPNGDLTEIGGKKEADVNGEEVPKERTPFKKVK